MPNDELCVIVYTIYKMQKIKCMTKHDLKSFKSSLMKIFVFHIINIICSILLYTSYILYTFVILILESKKMLLKKQYLKENTQLHVYYLMQLLFLILTICTDILPITKLFT